MAKRIVSRGPVMGGLAILSPELFRELDDAARTLARRPLRVYRRSESQCWGKCQFMATSLYLDVRLLKSADGKQAMFAEMSNLEIASEIEVRQFHGAKRPEIDLSEVPAERIHEFVAFHEIGHMVDNFSHWDVQIKLSREMANEARKANEVLADRYAWSRVFPGRKLPIRAGCEGVDAWLSYIQEKLTAYGVAKATLSSRRKPLPKDSLTFVPMEHVERGIPWSPRLRITRKNAPEWVSALAQAKKDRRGYDRRAFKRTAQEMAEIWAEIARKPDSLAQRLYKEHRSMFEWKWQREYLKSARA